VKTKTRKPVAASAVATESGRHVSRAADTAVPIVGSRIKAALPAYAKTRAAPDWQTQLLEGSDTSLPPQSSAVPTTTMIAAKAASAVAAIPARTIDVRRTP
jgi:hypothetical protein